MEPTQENKTNTEESFPISGTVLPSTDSTPTEPKIGTGSLEAIIVTPFYKKHLTLIISVIIALAIILGTGYYAYIRYYANDGTVATVNGKRIYETELTENITIIEQSASAQGMDITTQEARTKIREQALDALINTALLITAAQNADMKATDADIQGKYDEIVKELGSQEELTRRMAEIGLTEEKLQSNIMERILIDAYIEANTDIKTLTVSEEEVAAFVKSISIGDQKLPPLEEIRPQIEAQILGQKQQKLVEDLVTKLRTDANIEIHTK